MNKKAAEGLNGQPARVHGCTINMAGKAGAAITVHLPCTRIAGCKLPFAHDGGCYGTPAVEAWILALAAKEKTMANKMGPRPLKTCEDVQTVLAGIGQEKLLARIIAAYEAADGELLPSLRGEVVMRALRTARDLSIESGGRIYHTDIAERPLEIVLAWAAVEYLHGERCYVEGR